MNRTNKYETFEIFFSPLRLLYLPSKFAAVITFFVI